MMETKNKNILIYATLAAVILALIGTVIYLINKNKETEAEVVEVVEMMNFEKQQVEREFQDMATEFDGYTSNIKNDSLFKLLEDQKIKMRQLLEELRETKATNAKRISQLKAELASVRKLLVHYVNQIDALNAENKELRTENSEVKRKYTQASETAEILAKEKESLSEVVTRASKLEVSGFSFTPLNSRNKKTNMFTSTANLQLNYTVNKNITAQPGNKTMYIRITRPDNEVLTKGSGNVFEFENKNISYSIKKSFEYTSEAHSDVVYWKIEEVLPPGNYRVEFFCDGNLAGSFNFTFKK